MVFCGLLDLRGMLIIPYFVIGWILFLLIRYIFIVVYEGLGSEKSPEIIYKTWVSIFETMVRLR